MKMLMRVEYTKKNNKKSGVQTNTPNKKRQCDSKSSYKL